LTTIATMPRTPKSKSSTPLKVSQPKAKAAAEAPKGKGKAPPAQAAKHAHSETESSEQEEDDDDDEEEEDESGDDDEEEDGDDEDEEGDEFEDQGSSSEEEDEEAGGSDEEDKLNDAEKKSRRFVVDREAQIKEMREDGSLKLATHIHVDDLSSDDEVSSASDRETSLCSNELMALWCLQENINTIGNVPLRWYDEYDHIGYDVSGKKIMRSNAAGDGIDNAIAAKDDPNYEYVCIASIACWELLALTPVCLLP
jgi:ribosome biogenesis protein ERB1